MEHHGLFTDISNSFPGSGVLPNTNVKYHHHLPQIPPQPPPQAPPQTAGQGGNPQLYIPQQQQQQHQQHQQQQPIVGYGQQQQQQIHHQQQQQAQSQHVESDPIGSGLYHDTAGLFDATSALCTNNSGSNYSNVNNNGSNVNNSKTIEFTSRKFETNTGDSITYNINNINTNIVNNISGGSLGANGVQGLNPTQAAITGGSDLLGNTQFSTTGGNAQISFNKEGETNPTIINISNNNHNIMAPPYPYPYQAKISGMGALNDLNTKFGASHSWAGNGTTSHTATGEFALDSSVISNFEAKNPTKYHTSRSSYRYQQDYGQPSQQAQPTTAHYQHNYGLYHPEGAQATPIQQPNGHHGYEPYPHIVRSKYPVMEEVNRYGRSHQVHSTTHSQSHHDLMYNERSRYSNNFPSGYIPPAAGYHYQTAQPTSKTVLNPNVDYFNSNYIKQVPPLNAHQASHYIPSRTAYSHQNPTIPGYHHHQSYALNHAPAYEDPYRHRSRHHTLQHHYSDGHHGQQAYPNYPAPGANLAYPHNQKLSFSKSINDFYSPNVPTNTTHHYPNPLSNPTAPTVHHAPHYGIKYTSQTIVPPMTQPKPSNHPVPTSQPAQKPTHNSYYDTPNPVIDMNHPLIDLEEQINSVKILKSSREGSNYDPNHALNYDCQQKYLMNRYLYSKTTSSNSTPTSTDGYVPNGAHINTSTNLNNYGYPNMEEFVMGSRNFSLDENLKDKNLRDYLSSWNETEEEDTASAATSDKKETNNNQAAHQNFESCKYLQQVLDEQLPPLHGGVIVANVQNGTGNLPDILIDLEKTKDDAPKVGQETTEVGEKLYILETYDVPHSELNKYKHLSVINELPKNVVPIHDSADSLKFLEEIESNRDKYYQTELESEVVYDERKKDEEKKEKQSMPTIVLDDDEVEAVVEDGSGTVCEEQSKVEEHPQVSEVVQEEKEVVSEEAPKEKEEPQNQPDESSFKVPHYIPKYRKRRYQFDSYDYPRFPKRARRSSIEDFLHCDVKMPKPKPPVQYNPKQLFSICVAALNSREYRRYAKADLAKRQELAAKKSQGESQAEQVGVSEEPQEKGVEEKLVNQEVDAEECSVDSDVAVSMECSEEKKDVELDDFPMQSVTINKYEDEDSCEEKKDVQPEEPPVQSDIPIVETSNENNIAEAQGEGLAGESPMEHDTHESADNHEKHHEKDKSVQSDIPIDETSDENNIEEKQGEDLAEESPMEHDLHESTNNCEKHHASVHESSNKNTIAEKQVEGLAEESPMEYNSNESVYYGEKHHEEDISVQRNISNDESSHENSISKAQEEGLAEESAMEHDSHESVGYGEKLYEGATSVQSDIPIDETSNEDTIAGTQVKDHLEGSPMDQNIEESADICEKHHVEENVEEVEELSEQPAEMRITEQSNTDNEIIESSQSCSVEGKDIEEESVDGESEEQAEEPKDVDNNEETQGQGYAMDPASPPVPVIDSEKSNHHDEITKPTESVQTDDEEEHQSDDDAPIEVDDSETEDEVFELPTETQSAASVCERVSVIIDEAKKVEEEEVAAQAENTAQEETIEVSDEETSTETESQRVPVIQKAESFETPKMYEPMDTDELIPCFNPPSLRDLTDAAFECYRVLYDYQRVAPLRQLCFEYLLSRNMLPQPQSLQKLCEQFICNNRHLFIIEEVRNEPQRLQDLCQKVLNETNIIIDVNNFCIIGEEAEQEKPSQGRVFIVEDDHGSIEDLLRENDDMDGEVIVLSDDVGDEHEIFLGDAGCDGDVQVVLESSQALSDTESEIYRKVEREIERMMTTSSDEEDEASKKYEEQIGDVELDNEFYSFVGDDECIQYEEVVPINKQAHRRESLINELQRKYMVPKGRALTSRLKLLRKYVYYQRFIKTRDHGMQSKRRFFSRKLNCLRRKIEAMRRSVSVSVIDDDSDSNDSSFSGISSSSSSSSSSHSSSSGSASGNSSESEEAAVTETETMERSSGHASEDSSSQSSSSSVGERLIETNNNQLDLSTLTKPAKIESQQFAKEEDNSSNSSDSRSRGFVRRSASISPLVKKKKMSFEESLLNIDQMYKKTNSPAQSTSSPSNSNSSSPAPVRQRILTKAYCGPNVVVNVNNNREAPRKLIIPSYKIFNQALAIPTPTENDPPIPSRQPVRRRNSSAGSSSSSNSTRCHLVNCTQRSSGLIRVNYPNKPSPSNRSTASNGTNATTTRSHAIPAGFDRRIPYVRLERIDYVEKLAEKYRQQQRQQAQRQQQEQFAKLRQRRKSTFS
ncbi:AAEL005044-PA [Aedes aegypti]|uniref:AAEL005044-PA n=1 Tax=Aedes aegypti TaxID=7159 RepID=Q17B99_AEDAE|nr:AAEL005044-PA [Aedes aegypti]